METATTDYQLTCSRLDVILNCQLTPPLARLVEVMLCGWQLTKAANANQEDQFDIKTNQADKYQVYAPAIDFDKTHSDLVDAFNELLICIAYLACKKAPNMRLIHGGAMVRDGRIEILLGGHKAGKSSYLARYCNQQDALISDDLLLIDEEHQLFGLGFPLRLRRPIADDILAKVGAKQMLAGHALVYLGPKAFAMYPAGKALEPDRLYLLENYQSQRMMRYKWRSMIEQRLIPVA